MSQARCTAPSSPPKRSRPAKPTHTEVPAGKPFPNLAEAGLFPRLCHAVPRVPPADRSRQETAAAISRTEIRELSASDCERLSALRFACCSEEPRAFTAPASERWPKPPLVRPDCPRSRRRDRFGPLRRVNRVPCCRSRGFEPKLEPRSGPTEVCRPLPSPPSRAVLDSETDHHRRAVPEGSVGCGSLGLAASVSFGFPLTEIRSLPAFNPVVPPATEVLTKPRLARLLRRRGSQLQGVAPPTSP